MKQLETMQTCCKKPWMKPHVKVVEISGADIICQSGDLERYNPEDYNPWG